MQKSILKWAGGKSKLLDRIFNEFNAISPASSGSFFDVFAGSAVVALNTDKLLNPPSRIIINDFNPDLACLYNQIKSNPKGLWSQVEDLFSNENNNQERYLALRSEFNSPLSCNQRKAALFLYLNKHGFNGLCRYNSTGGFNVPFGKMANPTINKDDFFQISKVLKKSNILNEDFLAVMTKAKPGDLVYCDPPYLPLDDQKSNFENYSGKGFGKSNQKALADKAEELAGFGVTVIVSNHDTETARDLYKNAKLIVSFPVRRSISQNADGRKKVKELLAIFKS